MSAADHLGVRVAVGVSGAGKTYGVRQSVYRAVRDGMPVIVLDRMCEWTRVPAELGGVTAGVTSLEAAASRVEAGARLVIVRTRDVEAAAEEACAWARDYGGPAGVAIPEAHRAMPNGGRLPTAIDDVVTAWRHHQAALWVDTQRLARLDRTVTEQARELRIYAVVGDRDTAVLRELGGRELADAVREAASRLERGEAGWHVCLSLRRTPPYELTRES